MGGIFVRLSSQSRNLRASLVWSLLVIGLYLMAPVATTTEARASSQASVAIEKDAEARKDLETLPTLWPFDSSRGYYVVRYDNASLQMMKPRRALMVQWVFRYIESNTGIKFVATDDSSVPKITFGEGECQSSIGMSEDHVLLLNDKCESRAQILHEFMHSLGFHHEHLRPDRGQHIRLIEPVSDDYSITNKIHNYTILPYDILSVMHYPATSDGSSSPIVPLNKAFLPLLLTSRTYLTNCDWFRLRLLYPPGGVPITQKTCTPNCLRIDMIPTPLCYTLMKTPKECSLTCKYDNSGYYDAGFCEPGDSSFDHHEECVEIRADPGQMKLQDHVEQVTSMLDSLDQATDSACTKKRKEMRSQDILKCYDYVAACPKEMAIYLNLSTDLCGHGISKNKLRLRSGCRSVQSQPTSRHTANNFLQASSFNVFWLLVSCFLLMSTDWSRGPLRQSRGVEV